MTDREAKAEIWFTWDDEKDDHPEGWEWDYLLRTPVNRVVITEEEDANNPRTDM